MGRSAEKIRRAGVRIGLGMIRRAVLGKIGAAAAPPVVDEQQEKELVEYTQRIQELIGSNTKSRNNAPAVERGTKVLSVPQ
jgi:hypothetical protein